MVGNGVVAGRRAGETPLLASATPIGPLVDIGTGGGGVAVVIQAEQAIGVDDAVVTIAVADHMPFLAMH